MLNNLRLALRQLWKHPGFTAVAVLTLALGIGANTAIFGFLDRIFLRPLPVTKPQELVMLKYRSQTGYGGSAFVYPVYRSFREQSKEVFSGLIASWMGLADLRVSNWQAEVPALAVSSDYFSVLGITPALGRGFLPEEDRTPGAHPVAIISYELWQNHFDGDRAVLDKTIRLQDHSLTVVGVAPPRFSGTYAGIGPAVYVPLATWAHIKGISLEKRKYDWLNLTGRLNPGVKPAQAQAALRVVARRIHAVTPQNTPTEITVIDGSRGTNIWTEENLWWPFALAQAVTVLVLMVACANVANLLLVRGTTRRKEFAIRAAMGAKRRDIIRQLMVENTLLVVISGAAGVFLAQWMTGLLRGALTMASVANMPIRIDGRILLFGLFFS